MESKMKNKLNKNYLIIGTVVLVLIIGYYFVQDSFITKIKEVSEEELQQRFNLLSNSRTNFCAGPEIINVSNTDRLQGSCCSAMDLHRYEEQVIGLQKYSNIDKIPSDPYDIPKSLAEELLNYQKTIKLNPEQQLIYDRAVKLSHEGGPCCCKCWRWYAFEGLAKYLIIEYGFNSEQIAEIWDLEDGCGGTGHLHDT